ncbi:hypothetical protein BT96DRAFT_942449 [Gymnopus androsaceus JB14]|uniref:Uncharacterized protein n=1 Tax=Gymnopus androsaceus JB14 TaxID=1447944 RepID=A0A6A4HCH1_9AGAR|nr:hypothetical protein BT96DRAFT_942449 [Gymnopus androsaceus JB14]
MDDIGRRVKRDLTWSEYYHDSEVQRVPSPLPPPSVCAPFTTATRRRNINTRVVFSDKAPSGVLLYCGRRYQELLPESLKRPMHIGETRVDDTYVVVPGVHWVEGEEEGFCEQGFDSNLCDGRVKRANGMFMLVVTGVEALRSSSTTYIVSSSFHIQYGTFSS